MEKPINLSELYGEYVFDDAAMKKFMTKAVYDRLNQVINEGGELDIQTADSIAAAMKEWAMSNGCTHFTHWFQPLTGVTAEKHDSFLSVEKKTGKIITGFSGKELIKGESDASSFPSGGLRATFEARGYTAWDRTSPAFIRKDAAGATLCIPTAFCSYNGEALDQKTPLLRSMEVLNKQSLRLLKLFGNENVTKVLPMVGAEQEYFLVDGEKYRLRQDMKYTGRTLFGAKPSKGQELDDHYYGSVKQKIAAFMKNVNEELWKMGVPAKTQHNEVAPAQHELACIFEPANIAVDHNQIVMQTLKRVASARGMKCVLHEKPFSGVNGSGKHNNWSLNTTDGKNILDPGKHPNENPQFLLILSCIVKAVDEHAGLLRESAANVGNDLRLGADEAPPAVISIFLGEQLDNIVKEMIRTGVPGEIKNYGLVDTGVSVLPDFKKDGTDRNRTSPFAFTGNKFEFRMVGSRDSIAPANIVLNTIAAEAFSDACDILEKAEDLDRAVHDLTLENFTKHQRVLFDGNGYADSWVDEAKRRGLPNLPTMVSAIPELISDKSIAMFEKFGVLHKNELYSRAEVKFESYSKSVEIEAKVMINMTNKQIIPLIIDCQTDLAENISSLREIGFERVKVQEALLCRMSELLEETDAAVRDLSAKEDKVQNYAEGRQRAEYCHDVLVPAMASLRKPVDELELIVDKDLWPMPSYGEILFEV